jgi:dipeptidase E
MSQRRLLLISNSKDAEGQYLRWPAAVLRDFLGSSVHEVAFVPFAGVTVTYESYTARVRGVFADLGYDLASVHETDEPAALVRRADAIAVGGGNTWRLLERLQATGLLAVIRERALAGVPFLGWSAGAVVACPTMQTTNDMAVVVPPSARALDLVPFQINPHYTDFHPPGFQGETRAERLAEFVELNPGVRVFGLPECTLLRVEGDSIEYIGDGEAPLFERDLAVRRFRAGDDLRFLLRG